MEVLYRVDECGEKPKMQEGVNKIYTGSVISFLTMKCEYVSDSLRIVGVSCLDLDEKMHVACMMECVDDLSFVNHTMNTSDTSYRSMIYNQST